MFFSHSSHACYKKKVKKEKKNSQYGDNFFGARTLLCGILFASRIVKLTHIDPHMTSLL